MHYVKRLRGLSTDASLSLAQMALAWFAMRDEFTIAIAGSTWPANITANAAAGDLGLEPDRIAALDALDPPAHQGPV